MRLSSTWSWRRSLRSSAPSGSSSSRTLRPVRPAPARARRAAAGRRTAGSACASRSRRAGRARARRRRAAGPRPCLDLAPSQAERDVVADVEVGEQRVVLEDHVDRPLVGRLAGHVPVAQQDPPAGRQLEAADHAEGRRLAAARRPEQREELAGSRRRARRRRRRRTSPKRFSRLIEADLGDCARGSRHRAGRYAAGPRCAPTSPALWNTGPPGADGRPHRDGRGPRSIPTFANRAAGLASRLRPRGDPLEGALPAGVERLAGLVEVDEDRRVVRRRRRALARLAVDLGPDDALRDRLGWRTAGRCACPRCGGTCRPGSPTTRSRPVSGRTDR